MPDLPTSITFSAIVPAYNRAALLPRAIKSCLSQGPRLVEVIVVDDASTDNTVQVAASIDDRRVRILKHAVNRGPGAARNTGALAATGEFLVMLDSDDELLPGAIEFLAEFARNVPERVGNIASSCLRDDGEPSPWPRPAGERLFTYHDFLRFTDLLKVSDWLNCIRRQVFHTLRYHEGRVPEGVFHLDLARQHDFFLTPRFCAHVHCDADNRLSREPLPAFSSNEKLRDNALHMTRALAHVLHVHGHDLKAHAPRSYRRYCREAAGHLALLGLRRPALTFTLANLRYLDVRTVAKTLVGLVSPRYLASLLVLRARARQPGLLAQTGRAGRAGSKPRDDHTNGQMAR